MPKVYCKADRWNEMREKIQGRRAVLRLSYRDLAARIGCGESTANRWCNDPGTITLADYADLMAALEFKDYEARALIPVRKT